ncbi:hypothetical protein HK099_003254 [Clydaea vesicula]|uniref:Rab-GAP TBC domain-containing protein n=1 Tax=Clydaea vesicula TaxID=447962 RepID=A0AAD5U570_9FUNG|nr:hypothetical protein HK099_003254 [Clydaea vesicula]KAJ3384039.1 hypothetical protein HDU92_003788 [Lobulomyces angularis]
MLNEKEMHELMQTSTSKYFREILLAEFLKISTSNSSIQQHQQELRSLKDQITLKESGNIFTSEGSTIEFEKEDSVSNDELIPTSNNTSSYQEHGLPSKYGTNMKDAKERSFYSEEDIYNCVIDMGKEFDTEAPSVYSNFWSSMYLRFKTWNSNELAILFEELHPKYPHLGLDDTVLDGNQRENFLTSRAALANKIVETSSYKDAKAFAKGGIPMDVRYSMYSFLLVEEEYPEQRATMITAHLRESVLKYIYLTDLIISIDTEICKNDDNFFIFEDIIKGILMLWSRDDWFLEKMDNDELVGGIFFNQSTGQEIPYPPSGILPVFGLSCYALPLCYFNLTPDSAYLIFRQLYRRSSIGPLCALFENLLKERDAPLFYHLMHTIKIPPLKIAFKWILWAFVGVLEVTQVLLLWDRVIGYGEAGGNELFSITSAAIFLYKKKELSLARDEKDVIV